MIRMDHLIPYIRLGSLLLIGSTLLTNMLNSLPELLPGWRLRLIVGVCALLAILVLTRLSLM